MKRYGKPQEIVTDRLRSYRAAMKIIGNETAQEVGRWLNNRCENSHLPFRRREQAMQQYRRLRSLQKFVSIHASVHNHFNHERHLTNREIFKEMPYWPSGSNLVRHNRGTAMPFYAIQRRGRIRPVSAVDGVIFQCPVERNTLMNFPKRKL
jgi:hypothetical protein